MPAARRQTSLTTEVHRCATINFRSIATDRSSRKTDRTKALTHVPITDIIPDIHGQAEKLRIALKTLGWHRKATGWTHAEPARRIVFLGDFIDRGPENGAVIRIVRELMDAGRATAIMGNHELNALHFHMVDPDTGKPLRPHDAKNMSQHASFLKEFPLNARGTTEVLTWMRDLPLFIEEPDYRAVHAAWIGSAIKDLRRHAADGVLNDEQLIRAGRKGDAIHDLAETLAKGPEHPLPEGHTFKDKGGHERRDVRLKWWSRTASTWRDIAMSVPDIGQLPADRLPQSLVATVYPPEERPVFFGHYWLSGEPELQAPNALCLDYSAGTDGPLVTYVHEEGALNLDLTNLTMHRV